MLEKKIINPVSLQSNIYKIVRGGSYARCVREGNFVGSLEYLPHSKCYTRRYTRRYNILGFLGFRVCIKRKA